MQHLTPLVGGANLNVVAASGDNFLLTNLPIANLPASTP
jgi:hypothetical protein